MRRSAMFLAAKAVSLMIAGAQAGAVQAGGAATSAAVTVRTENFPRPPYSGATYYIYERGGRTICTKLEVCNKFDQCDRQYVAGTFKDSEDVETGAPYGTTPAVEIPRASLAKHVCLTRYGLVGAR